MPKKTLIMRGKVTEVDAAAKTSTVKGTMKSGQTRKRAFTVGDKTKVTIRGTAGSLDELKSGDSVRVAYTKTGELRLAREFAVVEAHSKKI
ncbi:MAG TPA: hypothetical protein VFW45_03340 [Candidatus Polarisedimenticolia bacterium]|nr:hypothetical protein [Candidatus Polarisedimenticolia bacterium]